MNAEQKKLLVEIENEINVINPLIIRFFLAGDVTANDIDYLNKMIGRLLTRRSNETMICFSSEEPCSK